MHPERFDTVSRLLAKRRLSRSLALQGAFNSGGAIAGSRSAASQEATPDPTPTADHGPTMLFLQSFRSGSIVPKNGEDGRYTVTLEQGLGETIYFSDRPDRVVGVSPTERFLNGLGFPEDNPPNAALVVETATGETDIAVVELFHPVFNPEDDGVTYDIAVLAAWQSSLDLGFVESPTDLSELATSFGSAHLFIDDCPSGDIYCSVGDNTVGAFSNEAHNGYCYSGWQWSCLPCTPWYDSYTDLVAYWTNRCNREFSDCGGNCVPHNLCNAAWRCEVS